MHLDWTIPVGTILLLAVQFIAGVIGVMRAFARIERSIDARFNEFNLKLNSVQDRDIRDLQGRITRLESGQDEWTKSLRQRTHDLADIVNGIILKVDRLERPDGWTSQGENKPRFGDSTR